MVFSGDAVNKPIQNGFLGKNNVLQKLQLKA